MKATFDVGIPPKVNPDPVKAEFGWYRVQFKEDNEVVIALVSAYGVTYIAENGKVSYSDREFFNRRYILQEYFPNATFNVKLRGDNV